MKKAQRRKPEPVKVAAPELQALLDDAREACKSSDKEGLQEAAAAIAAAINLPLDGEKVRLRYKFCRDGGETWDRHKDIGGSVAELADFIGERYSTWSYTYFMDGLPDQSTEKIIGIEWKRYPKREVEPYKAEIIASNVYDDDENPVDIWNDWR